MSPRRARRARRTRLLFVLFGAVVVVWMAIVGLTLWNARRDTQRGIDRLEQGRDVLTLQDVGEGKSEPYLEDALGDFTHAHDAVRAPWVAPLRVIPVVGRQVRSVDSMTGAAREVVSIGLNTIQESRRELDAAPTTGPARVALADRLAVLARRAAARLDAIDLGPNTALVPPLAHARNRFDEQLARADEAAARLRDASAGFSDFLHGPTRYLVIAANNNEMRVGSGTFLSAGTLEVQNGELHVGDFTPTVDLMLPAGAVPITGDFADRWGFQHPSEEWRSLGASPEFPVQAELAARMWKAKTGQDVDGVLVLDPIALQSLLQVTGPVVVDGKRYDTKNVLDEIYVQQYFGVTSNATNQERRDRLSAVARVALARLNGPGWSATDFVDAMARPATGRHMLAWSRRDRQQRAWSAAHTGGELVPESVLLGILNAGGNKLDHFLQVQAGLSAVERADGRHVDVDVSLDNTTPFHLPQYIVGPYPGLPGMTAGRYRGMLVLQMPGAAHDIKVTNAKGEAMSPSVIGRDGINQTVATPFDLPRGSDTRFTVSFTIPSSITSLNVEPSARYPYVHWKYGADEWDDTSDTTVDF